LTTPVDGAPGLPIGPTALPREVRDGTPDQQKAYRAALSFERVLVNQLLQSLGDDAMGMGSGGGEDEDGGSSGAPAAYKQMLPNTLADSLTQGGGIGLAQSIYKSFPTEPK
jgi:Rod binding domain-containing protein